MTEGLFIGGPLDGERRVYRSGNRVVVPIRTSLPPGPGNGPADDAVVTHFEYLFVEWHNHDEVGGLTLFGFWVPAAEPNPRLYVMQKLVAAYEEGAALPDDLFSHQSAWRAGLVLAKHSSQPPSVDMDDKAYWQHEIDVFDRVFAELAERSKS